MQISVDITVDDRFAARLQRAAARVQHLEPVYDDFVDVLLRSGRRVFAQQPGWPDVSDETKSDPAHKATLRRTDRLHDALTRSGAPGQLRDRAGLRFGLAHTGAAYYGRFLNRRFKLLQPNRPEIAEIADRVRDHILG